MRDRSYYGLIKNKRSTNLDERLARKYRWYSYFRRSDGSIYTKALYEAIKALKEATKDINEHEANTHVYYEGLSYAFDSYEVAYALLDICVSAFGEETVLDAWDVNYDFINVIFDFADQVLELKETNQMKFTNLGKLLIDFIEAAAKSLGKVVDYSDDVMNEIYNNTSELYSKIRKIRRRQYSALLDSIKKWVKTAIALLPATSWGLAKSNSPKSNLVNNLAKVEVGKHADDMYVLLELLKSRTVSYKILKERAEKNRESLDTLLSKYIVRLQNYYKFSNPENAPNAITRDTTYKQHIRLLKHLDTLAAGTHLQEMIASMPFYEAMRLQYLKMKDSADFKNSMAAVDELMLTCETSKTDEGYREYVKVLKEYAKAGRISVVTRGSVIFMEVMDENGVFLYKLAIRPMEAGKAYRIKFRLDSRNPYTTKYPSHVLYYDKDQVSKYVIWDPAEGYKQGMGAGYVGIYVESPRGSILDAIVIIFDVSISLSQSK